MAVKARATLVIAYGLGKNAESFEVGDQFLPIYDGLEALGFVQRGAEGDGKLTNRFFLAGAGYYLAKWAIQSELVNVDESKEGQDA